MLMRCLVACCFVQMSLAHLAGAQPPLERVTLGEPRQQIEGWGASLATWDQASRYSDPRWLATWEDLGLNILRISLMKSVLTHPNGRFDTPVPIAPELDANIARMDFDVNSVRIFGEHARWLQENAEAALVVGSVWSPPHWMKGPTGREQTWLGLTEELPTPWLSGERIEGVGAGRGDSIGGRLRTEDPEILEAYGRYIAAWVVGFERRWGTPLHAISIQNESLFENPFDSMTVGIGADGEEDYRQYAMLLDSVRSAWREYGLQTRIKGPHLAQIGPTPQNPWSLVPAMNLIDAVRRWDDGALLDFLDYFNTNYYMPAHEGGAQTTAAFVYGRENVEADWARWARVPGVATHAKPVWISEAGGEQTRWSTSTNSGEPRENGALTVAVKMFNALVHADAVSYIYWLVTDGQAEPGENTLLGIDQLDAPLESAKYAAFRHFTRFIRPGARRLHAAFDNGHATLHGASQFDALNGLSIAAFRHDDDRKLTFISLNMTNETRRLSIELPEGYSAGSATAWASSEEKRFEALPTGSLPDGSLTFELAPSSIATVQTTAPTN
jgi:O-glycosyl hydrolase